MATKRKKSRDPSWAPIERLKLEEAVHGLRVVLVEDGDEVELGTEGTITDPDKAKIWQLDQVDRIRIQVGGVLVKSDEGFLFVTHHTCLEFL